MATRSTSRAGSSPASTRSARGPVRARWLGDDHRRLVRRQAAQFAERHRPAPRQQLLVHRPPYGGQLYEGATDAPGGRSNPAGRRKPRLGQPPEIGTLKRELPTNVYRVDPSGRIDVVLSEERLPDPNGLAFSPDYKKLYVISTGPGPGDTGPGGKRDMYVFDVGADNKLSNQQLFSDFMIDGIKCGPDGVRCDVDGNLWVSSNGGRALGYSGVTMWTPEGKLIGRIRLPEVCGNLCSAAPSAIGCSWLAANHCTPSTSTRRAPHRAKEKPGSESKNHASLPNAAGDMGRPSGRLSSPRLTRAWS